MISILWIYTKIEENNDISSKACNLVNTNEKTELASGIEGTVYKLNNENNENNKIIKINKVVEPTEEYKNYYYSKIEIIDNLNNIIRDSTEFKPNLLQTEIKFCNDTQQLVETQRFINGITLEKEITNMFKIGSFLNFIKQKDKDKDNQEKLNNYIIKIVGTINFLYQNKFFHNDTHVENIMIENETPIIIDYGYLSREPLNGNYRTYNNEKETEKLTTPFLDIGQLLNTIINKIDNINKLNNNKLNNNDVYLNLKNILLQQGDFHVLILALIIVDYYWKKIIVKKLLT
jgi:hypothetical protein